MSIEDNEWFDIAFDKLKHWLDLITGTCTKECVRTVIDVADAIDSQIEKVIPDKVGLTKEEEHIRTVYHHKTLKVNGLRKQLEKATQENRHDIIDELHDAKLDLNLYIQEYRCEIIGIILKFRAAYYEIGHTTPLDDQHSPLADAERSDEAFIQVFKNHPPPRNWQKRARELQAKRCKKDKKVYKTVRERDHPQLKSHEYIEKEHSMIYKWLQEAESTLNAITASCTEQCLNNVDDSTQDNNKCNVVCDKEIMDKYGLNKEEQKIRDEYFKKEQALTDIERQMDMKIKGTAMRLRMAKKEAQRALLDFEFNHQNEIMKIRRKYKQKGEILKRKEVYPGYAKDVEQRAAIWRKQHPDNPLVILEIEREKRLERERQREEEKKRNEIENIKVKKIDFDFYNDRKKMDEHQKNTEETKEVEVVPEVQEEKKAEKTVGFKERKKKKKHPWKNTLSKVKKVFSKSKSKGWKHKSEDISERITLKNAIGEEGVETVLNPQHVIPPAAAYMDGYQDNVIGMKDELMNGYLMDDVDRMDIGKDVDYGYRYVDGDAIHMNYMNEMMIVCLFVMILVCFFSGIAIGIWSYLFMNKMENGNNNVKSESNNGNYQYNSI